MGQLQEIESDLVKLGYQVIAVSADRPAKVRETLAKSEFKYKLYSDSSATASAAFGIAYHVPDAYIQRVKQYNIDLEAASGNQKHILPVPSVFILDPDATIRFEYVNPDYKIRIQPQVLLAAARAEAKQMAEEKKAGEK